MADPATLTAPNRMYNRLFWLDWISRLWVIGTFLWIIVLVFQTVGNSLPGAQVQVTLPAHQDYPPASGSLHYSGSAYVVQHTSVMFTEATMTVTNLPMWTVILIGLGQIFAAISSGGIAWCIFILVRRLRENQPFAGSTSRAFVAAGLILGIGSTASTLLTSLGHSGISVAYIPKYGNLMVGGSGSSTWVDFLPLFLAGVLFALAGVFRYGANLERERLQLQRETEGLV